MSQQLLAIVALFFISVVASDKCYYTKFNPDHTGCKKRNPQCNILDNRVTDDDKKLVVRLHNQYREKVATGNAVAKSGNLPTASNMLEMVWDDELAYIAQRHAETCEFKHDCSDCRRVDRFYVGQNLYMSWSSNMPSSSSQWEGSVKSFYDEVQKFEEKDINPYKFSTEYGHFSQVAWADSWRLGCGKVVFKKDKWYQTLIVCEYGPGGNYIGAAMYKEGSPCSACPSDSCCGDSCNQYGVHSDYKGLCKKLS